MGTAMTIDHSVARIALPILWPMLSYNHFRFWRSWLKSDLVKREKFWWWFTWRGTLLAVSTAMVIYSTYTYFQWVPVSSKIHSHLH
jgi:hypothetical protein